MKRIITIFLVLVILLGTVTVFSVSAEPQTVYSGKCSPFSNNLTWTFDTVRGELVISGNGKMHDFDYDSDLGATVIPWSEYTSSIKKITVEYGVTSINDGAAFSGCINLECVTLPATLTRIGNRTFEGCTKLLTIDLPDSLRSIGEKAFSGCTDLRRFELPDSIMIICKDAFLNCSNLYLSEYENAKYLGTKDNPYFCLYKAVNTDIASATVHQSAKIICDYAFENCTDLNSIKLSDSLTFIGNKAFSGCYSLEFNEYQGVEYLGNIENPYIYLYNVTDRNISKATIHKDTKIIAERAFSFCENLTAVDIPVGVRSIGDRAFFYCTALESIAIPRSVVHIGQELHFCSSSTTGGCKLKVYYCGTEEEWAALVADSDFYYNRLVLHRYDIEEIITPPEHTEIGKKTITCSICGDSVERDIAKLSEHTYNEYERVDAEQHKAICECTDYKLEEHDWDDGVFNPSPTHLDYGTKIYTCTDCGETKTERADKLMVHEYSSFEKHDATQHKKSCPCGDIAYADHNWNDGTVTVQPTKEADGVKTYTCTDCGETKTETLEKLKAETSATENTVNTAANTTVKSEVENDSGCESYFGGSVGIILLASVLSAVAVKKKKRE